jgi:hypothetical protein
MDPMKRSTDQLAKLILQRRQCLTQMRDLGHKQSELIATGEMGSLLRLLAAKQHLLNAMQAIEQELAPFHEEDPEKRVWPSPESRLQTAQHSDQCRQLLAEVIQLEKNNEQQITIRRDEIASQLHLANTASTARGAYQAQQTATAARADKAHAQTTSGRAGTTTWTDQLDIQCDP